MFKACHSSLHSLILSNPVVQLYRRLCRYLCNILSLVDPISSLIACCLLDLRAQDIVDSALGQWRAGFVAFLSLVSLI
jgi:hypothetical protein